MANKKKLKWYHYTAKVILIVFASLLFPLLILIALASGEGPFYMYKEMWYD